MIEDLRSGEEPERRHLTRSGPAPALRHSSAGPSPWDEHLVLPEERAGPPVRPFSLTSSSARDLVSRPCDVLVVCLRILPLLFAM